MNIIFHQIYTMADSDAQPQPVEMQHQVTTKNPTTRPKNPQQLAAGKAVAERTRLVCKAQKKAAAEAAVIIENNKAKTKTPVVAGPPTESENTLSSVNHQKCSHHHPMAQCHQHCRFSGGDILQTRRDQKGFSPKSHCRLLHPCLWMPLCCVK